MCIIQFVYPGVNNDTGIGELPFQICCMVYANSIIGLYQHKCRRNHAGRGLSASRLGPPTNEAQGFHYLDHIYKEKKLHSWLVFGPFLSYFGD
jgi:hypothetical protein